MSNNQVKILPAGSGHGATDQGIPYSVVDQRN